MNRRRTMATLWRPLPRLAGPSAALGCLLLAGAFTMVPDPAAADFRLCNNTTSRVGIALGYKENDGWTTEGWWNLPARNARPCCAVCWWRASLHLCGRL